jgi:hypothetical protein
MNAQLTQWKMAADRLWSSPGFDYSQALQLVSEIMRQCSEQDLQQAAEEAVPYLRAACAKTADQWRKQTAHRRFGGIRDGLHLRTGARFGRRGADAALTPDERCRRLLGLPLDRRVFGPEISRAYKQAAKKAHPDAGGTQNAFLELTAARDALMKAL